MYTQNLIKKLTEEKKFDSPEYILLNEVLGNMFTCRLQPRPDCYYDSDKLSNKEMYVAMQGASEFTTGGMPDRIYLPLSPSLFTLI